MDCARRLTKLRFSALATSPTKSRQDLMTSNGKNIERLFPFIKRARALIVGQHVILRSKSQLQFVLITHDISDRGKSEALRKFKHYPIVQRFRSADIHKHFDLKGVKLLGFRKSGLSKSLYAELKRYRINEPVVSKKDEDQSTATQGVDKKTKRTESKSAPRVREASRKPARTTSQPPQTP